MRIAVYGDIHGHWLDFKESVAELHAREPLDLVLQCGDAQPFRDEADLEYMHCPSKYREPGDFWAFHQGIEEFPVPVLFIGGNHEPWGFLDQHRDGGQLAHNVQFLGRAGHTTVNGLRVAGVSGIYSPTYFGEPRPASPYPVSRRKQATYYNQDDIDRVLAVGRADILLLHNWPDSGHSKWATLGHLKLGHFRSVRSPCYGSLHPGGYRPGQRLRRARYHVTSRRLWLRPLRGGGIPRGQLIQEPASGVIDANPQRHPPGHHDREFWPATLAARRTNGEPFFLGPESSGPFL